MLSDLKKFKVQAILVVDYKKRNDHKIFHLIAKPTVCDWDIEEAFESMHQSIMIKSKKYVSKDWVVLYVITKHSIKIFKC